MHASLQSTRAAVHVQLRQFDQHSLASTGHVEHQHRMVGSNNIENSLHPDYALTTATFRAAPHASHLPFTRRPTILNLVIIILGLQFLHHRPLSFRHL